MKLKEKTFHQLWCKYAEEGNQGSPTPSPRTNRRPPTQYPPSTARCQGVQVPRTAMQQAKDTQLDELTAIPSHGRNLHSTKILIFAFRMILAKNDVSTCLTLNLAGNC